MTRIGAAAIAAGNAITSGYGGLCLKFVRTCFDVPAKYATARDARTHATAFHATSDPMTIPAGVPVFLGDNHVALAVGNGNMRTTNSATNRVSTVTIASWVRAGHALRGWSEDLNGVRVYTKPAPAPAPADGVLRKGMYNNAAVGRLQTGLRRAFPGYRNSVKVKRGQLITVDEDFGDQTAAWVTEFQSRVPGLAPTGVVDGPTRSALARYGVTF